MIQRKAILLGLAAAVIVVASLYVQANSGGDIPYPLGLPEMGTCKDRADQRGGRSFCAMNIPPSTSPANVAYPPCERGELG